MALASPGYVDADVERYLDEPDPSVRSTFERDRARIVHSASLRRLAAKTQVVGPSTSDFTRNRLTHTLEVAQVGRDLAHSLGCDQNIVEAACLAHDLGHPPFGHNGEAALNAAAADVGGFEGNAQTLRLLTRLEAKRIGPDGRSAGLNLTRAVLDAATKYPWRLREAPPPRGRHADGLPRAVRKFGVYDDDATVFTWMRRGAPSGTTCIEAQIMDFADDVAYSVHDVEDAVVAGRVQPPLLADPGLRTDIWQTVRDWYDTGLSNEALEAAYARLSNDPAWPQALYDGSRQHLAGLKNLTSRLINRFCVAVQHEVIVRDLPPVLVRYAADLPVPATVKAEIAVLKGIAAHLVMKADDHVVSHARERDLLTELVAAIERSAPEGLEPTFRADFETAADDSERRRVIIDSVASLTDLSAVEKHRGLIRTA
ncbi:MAG TPA: deoxyguanosinetriphosphate triphosphohydrolase [Nocardioidaceae bacterium]|nr:deoxyguanosinetriphosphate triphosphohydrolase [Nocardioidaceae bacterium]